MVSAYALFTAAISATTALALPAADLNTAPKFVLQAKVIKDSVGAHHSKFRDTYVIGYHTAAGFNDATLSATKPDSYFTLNGTQLQTTFGSSSATYPYTVYGIRDSIYNSFGRVEINVSGAGSGYSFFTGFTIDDKNRLIGHTDTGSTGESQNSFGNWRACDWDLNTAQLFFTDKQYKPILPANCAEIELHALYLP